MPTSAQGRVLFADVFEPNRFSEPGKPKYTITLLFDKDADKAAIQELYAAATQAAKDKWGPKIDMKKVELPFVDGDEDKSEYESCKNQLLVKFTTRTKPLVYDRQRRQLTDPSEFYAGCFARVAYSPYTYDYSGHGVSLGLGAVQKTADGDPFGSRITEKNIDDYFEFDDLDGVDDLLS